MTKTIATLVALLTFFSMTPSQREEVTDWEKAYMVNMTVEEFDLISRTVEAESDRGSSEDSYEGRVLIALTILNRCYSEEFPNTITGVISQSGQFAVYGSGAVWNVNRTIYSDEAVLEAFLRLYRGTAPNVMYFNNSNYSYGTPYGYAGGNYFTVTNGG